MLKLWCSLMSLALLSAELHQADGERDDFQWRQSNSWLCSGWIPQGIQTNMCRVFCLFFLNRAPSASSSSAASDTKDGCSNGTCDCSS